MYLIKDIRLSMTCTFNKLSRYTSNHIKDHWKTIIRILKILRCILKYGLRYTRYSIVSEGYNDNNQICNIKDLKSISGFIFTWLLWSLILQLLIKPKKEQSGFKVFWVFLVGKNLCRLYVYVVISNLLSVEHKTVCIIINLDTFIKNIIPQDIFSQMILFLLTM